MSNDDGRHIFFVDDDDGISRVVSETLGQFDFKVTCFGSAADCIEHLNVAKCDLVITDLRLPEMDGFALLKHVKLLAPWLPVLVVTGYGDVSSAVECIKAGAADFVEKPLERNSFVQKVRSVLQESGTGSEVFTGELLTRAEKRVLKLVIDGWSSKDIARLLNRSRRTVEAHRANAMRKLGAENVIDLVKRACEIGLIKL